MQSKATTVTEYLNELPGDRRAALQALRKVINANLDKGFKEGIQYGMIGYFVPHSVYPSGYHCDKTQPLPFASIAAQKNHMAIYLFCIYCEPVTVEWFQEQWAKEKAKGNAGRLDMGKSCIRFKKIEDVPLELIGKTIKRMTAKRFIKAYETSIEETWRRSESKKTAKKTKKTSVKKVASKKTKKKTAKATTKRATKKKTTKEITKKTTKRAKVAKKPTIKKTARR